MALLVADTEPWNHAIGIDPGETTGLFAIQLGEGSVFTHRLRGATTLRGQVSQEHRMGQPDPWWFKEARMVRNIAGRIYAVAERWGVLECCHLAVEDFVLRENTTDRNLLSPVRVTSGLLALFETMDDINVVAHFNQASNGKVGVPDPALKRFGMYVPGEGGVHSNDACRQAIIVLRKMSEGKA